MARHTLICYDIADARRLGRVHRCIMRHALPVQYSVYLHQGSQQELQSLLAELEALIDPESDDIRAYPLPERIDVHFGGRGSTEGLHFPGAPLFAEYREPVPEPERQYGLDLQTAQE